MPESVCFNMICGNSLGRSFSPSSNSPWYICFTDPRGSRRKPSANKRTLRPRHDTSSRSKVYLPVESSFPTLNRDLDLVESLPVVYEIRRGPCRGEQSD